MKTTKPKRTLLATLARKGARGKTLLNHALAVWLRQRDVSWRGYDFDGEQKAFSGLFKENVKLLPVGRAQDPPDNVVTAIRDAFSNSVSLIDPRAENDKEILDVLRACLKTNV